MLAHDLSSLMSVAKNAITHSILGREAAKKMQPATLVAGADPRQGASSEGAKGTNTHDFTDVLHLPKACIFCGEIWVGLADS